MTKFRYGTAVNMISHGSDVTEYKVRREDGKEWICIRPERHYSRLEHDVREQGFERVPEVLFGRQQATCRMDDDGLVWYADFVNQDEIYHRTLHDPNWFLRRLEERKEIFDNCKSKIKDFNSRIQDGDLTKETCIEYLRDWERLNSELFPYMFLALLTDEILIKDFRRLLTSHFDTAQATEILDDLLESEYSKNAIKGGYAPKKGKFFTFPPEAPYYPEGEIVLNRTTEQESEIYEKMLSSTVSEFWSSIDTYIRYRAFVPLVFQISEENFYVMRSLSIAMNHIVDHVGEYLLRSNLISDKQEMLRSDLDGLIAMIQEANFE